MKQVRICSYLSNFTGSLIESDLVGCWERMADHVVVAVKNARERRIIETTVPFIEDRPSDFSGTSGLICKKRAGWKEPFDDPEWSRGDSS